MKLLLIVAHPDDETFGCGSVLAHAAASGVESVVVCATRGELGDVAGGLTADEIGHLRECELRAACDMLGVARVEVLGWRDSGTDGDAAADCLVSATTVDVAKAVAALIDDVRPDVLMVPEGSDGHRDHLATRDATLAAIEMAAWKPTRTYLWCLTRSDLTEFAGIEMGTPDEAITTIVDVRRYLDLRWKAMRAHASQTPPYDSMSPELQDRFLASDHLIRVDPPFTGDDVERDWIP
jgi:LmbE family N-acetylglucosaminyl deacetylase